MTRDIQRRLQKLESQVPQQPTEDDQFVESLQSFLRYAVAYYLGDPTPEESIAEAYIRALAYPNSYEFLKACDANDADLHERIHLANIKLLAKFSVSWEHEWDQIADAFQRVEDGLPEFYKRALVDGTRSALRLR